MIEEIRAWVVACSTPLAAQFSTEEVLANFRYIQCLRLDGICQSRPIEGFAFVLDRLRFDESQR